MYIEARPLMREGATVNAWKTRKGATVNAWTSRPIHSFLGTSRQEGVTVNAWFIGLAVPGPA